VTTIALALLAAAGVLLTVRLMIGPSVADRVVAMDGLLIIVIGVIAADAAHTGRTAFIDVALVIGLLAFVGTGIAARFIEQRGA
jgi:multicomponent Na+:H+ antiporter subunit F